MVLSYLTVSLFRDCKRIVSVEIQVEKIYIVRLLHCFRQCMWMPRHVCSVGESGPCIDCVGLYFDLFLLFGRGFVTCIFGW